MTVKDLKQRLENIPDNLDVFLEVSDDDFTCGLAEDVKIFNLRFSDGKLEAFEDVLLISTV